MPCLTHGGLPCAVRTFLSNIIGTIARVCSVAKLQRIFLVKGYCISVHGIRNNALNFAAVTLEIYCLLNGFIINKCNDQMKWITREHPKIDRIACPWLIKRFIDKDAEIIYVPADDVITRSKELNAIPFDIAGVEYTHYGEECTFDYFIKKHDLHDEALKAIALIVRGADTDKHELAKQASGLWAISAGLAYNFKNDAALLEKGMVIYDALYSWAKYLKDQKHMQQPFEQELANAISGLIKNRSGYKKTPAWVKELKYILQDHVDTNLSLKEISRSLDIHPAYLSREFSKYFDNLSFGDYIRKLRIEKAIELLSSSTCTLTEIAYLTGFSDQSHFTRIFKLHTGKNPSAYKKELKKGKPHPNG